MLAQERRSKIATIIKKDGSISVEQLAEEFGVSPMTAWRDLRELAKDGDVCRVRGGAVRPACVSADEPTFAGKEHVNTREKRAIARYAARHLVADGDIVIVEGGTTAAEVATLLTAESLTILTNGLDVLNRVAAKLSGLTVLSCGGILREPSLTFVGPQAEQFFAGVRADKIILSAAALSVNDGLMDPNPLEIQIKQAMARSARQRIAVVDSTKFACRSLAVVLPSSEIDILVTDEGARPDTVAQLRQAGLDVRIARFEQ